MIFGDFERLFRPTTRVLLDWDRLLRRHVRIETRVLTTSKDAGDWFTVWYVAGDHGGEYLAGLSPLRVHEIAAGWSALPALRRQRLDAIGATMRSHPQCLLVAVYDCGRGTVVVDGNHRIVASFMFDIICPVLVCAIQGPPDPMILPDLANLP